MKTAFKSPTLKQRLLERYLQPFAVVAAALLIAACRSPFESDAAHSRVRLHNASPFHLDQVRYSTGTEPVQLGRLEAGTYSRYHFVPVAYAIAYVEAVMWGEIYATRAEHFANHARLQTGAYTYRVSVDSARRVLDVTLVED